MATINISLPEKLKKDAEALIGLGYYVSFSDLVRHSIRGLVEENKYDRWASEAKADAKAGRAVILKSKKDIEKYMKSVR